jgi:hypothetical protein
MACNFGCCIHSQCNNGGLSADIAGDRHGNTLECVIGACLINRWSNGLGTRHACGSARLRGAVFFAKHSDQRNARRRSLSLAGYADWANFAPIWLTWWMGDVAGALLITPVIVLWAKSSARLLQAPTPARSGAVFGTAAVIGLIAFSPLSRHIANSGPLAFSQLFH